MSHAARHKHKTLRIYAITSTESCAVTRKRFVEELDAAYAEITAYCWQPPLSFQADQQKKYRSHSCGWSSSRVHNSFVAFRVAFLVSRVMIGRCDLGIIHRPIVIYLPWNFQSRVELNFCTRHDSCGLRSCEPVGSTRRALTPRPRYKDCRL